MSLDRRRFLSAAVSLSLTGAATLVLSCRDDRGRVIRAQLELSRHFRDLAAIEVLGREALRVLPEGADARQLFERLAPERGARALLSEIRSQYARGQTVDLRGWQLALTEVRIYALVALAGDRAQ